MSLAAPFLTFPLGGGLKRLEKSPTGQQVSGLSSLAQAECIPVRWKAFCCSPDTITHIIPAGCWIVWLSPAPYNTSIHPSPPLYHSTLISELIGGKMTALPAGPVTLEGQTGTGSEDLPGSPRADSRPF